MQTTLARKLRIVPYTMQHLSLLILAYVHLGLAYKLRLFPYMEQVFCFLSYNSNIISSSSDTIL